MVDDVEQLLPEAIAFHSARRLDDAERAYRRILAVQPDHAHVHYLLGHLLNETNRLDESIEHQQRASLLRPGVVEYKIELGRMLGLAGRFDEAVDAYRGAIALRPDLGEPHNNLANALQNLGRYEEAIASYTRALAAQPSYPEALNNLGCALKDTFQWQQAIANFRRAIELRPEYPEAHWNLATALLSVGDLRAGWPHYEWRSHFATAPPRDFACPLWRGEPLGGRRILLHAEQGFGDTIQFVRFARHVAGRGGRIVLECQPQLVRLLKCLSEVETIAAQGEALPAFEVHCPLLSLPLALNIGTDDLLGAVPYLRADCNDVDRWAKRLAGDRARLKVGLAWAGSPVHVNDRNRSIPVEQFNALGGFSNVSFYSLQMGAPAAPAGLAFTDLTAEMNDFAETAALIMNLDLVIAVDTAVAHLAGALGKPTWVLLPTPGDFRWLLEREDSPWYPAMRLFRQRAQGDWSDSLERVRVALERWIEQL
jgi:Tfp pilus assembly protein PilF